MAFDPYLGWVDVPNPAQPPAGAKMIMASDLLRYEQGIEANEQEISTVAEALNTKADLVDGLVSESQLPPAHLVEDPDSPGFYLSGADTLGNRLVSVDPNLNLPDSLLDILDARNRESFVGKGELVVNLEDYGTVFDGITDNTLELQAAADAAKAAKATLWVPNALRVRIESAVDLRYIDVKFDGFLTVGAGAIPYGVLVGDSSNVRVGRKISFKSAMHVNSATQSNPCVRVQGLMGGDVEIGRNDYIQIYANESEEPGTGDACAYATYRFTGGSVRHLQLLGEGGQSWINENLFLGGDFRKITIGGTYTHNSNMFFKPSVEGANSLIDIQRGARNKFLNVRGEYGPKVRFGEQTWHNIITDGFESNPQSRATGFTVEEDLGIENILMATFDSFLEPHTVFRLDSKTPVFDTATPYPGLPIRPGISAMKVNASFQQIVRTAMIPITAGTSRLRRFEFASDAVLWRPRIRLYDADRVQLDASLLNLIDMTGGWSSVGGVDPYYQFGAAKDNWTLLITSPLVAFASIEVQSSGSTAGAMFNRLSVTAFRHGRDGDGLIDQWRRAFTSPHFGAKPTQGSARPGQVIEGPTGRTVCTAVASSALTVAAGAAASELTVVSTAGMAAADVIGVLLADGGTHWTTVASVGSSTKLTLAIGLTGSALAGAPLETVRWVTR